MWRVGSSALGLVLVVAACSGAPPPSGATSASTTTSPSSPGATAAAAVTASPTTAIPSPSPSAANEWPFVRSSCPGATGGTKVELVALGTSETAGWGIGADAAHSPGEAYPAQYADVLCRELGRTVELRSYFPSQSSSSLAPLGWWNERVADDAALRADLAAADIVVLWNLASHDMVPALLFGGCSGAWPDPVKSCFEATTASIRVDMDRLFDAISRSVPASATVLAADAYLTPAMFDAWASKEYWSDLRALIDPAPIVRALARKHGFTFVDTAAAFNGSTGAEPPPAGLFQADGLHPTAEGSRVIAEVFAKADGLGR